MLRITFNGIWWFLGFWSFIISMSYFFGKKKPDTLHENPIFWWPDFGDKESLIKTLKIIVIPSLILGTILIYDFFIPSSETEMAVVTDKGKGVWRGKYYISFRGEKYNHYEEFSEFIYNNISLGDKLDIEVSRILKEFKQATVYRDGKKICNLAGDDLLGLLIFGLGLLSTAVIFDDFADYPSFPLFLTVCIMSMSSLYILFRLALAYMQYSHG